MKDVNESRLTIGEVAEVVGLSVHALRFYERERLLISPIQRSPERQRRYSAVDVDWLRICVRLRESGMPLADLRRFAELIREGPGNESERLHVLNTHRARVESQIAALEHAHQIIVWKAEVYEQQLRAGSASELWDPRAQWTAES